MDIMRQAMSAKHVMALALLAMAERRLIVFHAQDRDIYIQIPV